MRRTSILFSTLGLTSLLTLLPSGALAQKKVYTTNADFDGGTGSNVCHGPAPKLDCWDNTPDQLVLGRTRVSKLARVWADNYRMGWIVGIDSKTGRQFARFDAAITHINGKPTGGQPAATVNNGPYFCNWHNQGNCPGRVTTDTNGDVWIINRAFGQQGTLAKFSGTVDHCIDRNGNGVIDTSSDVNGDGIVNPQDPAEYLGQGDECILATIPLGGVNHLPRGVAVDKKGKIWASTHNGRQVFRLDPNEPVALEAIINLAGTPGASCHPYSMATGGDYVFISCSGGPTVRIHIDTLQVQAAPCPGTYGVVADPGGQIAYLGGYFSGSSIYRVDYSAPNPQCEAFSAPGTQVTAVTLDYDGFLWASGYGNGQLLKIHPVTGAVVAQSATGPGPHGVSVDFNNRIWSISHGAPFIRVHDANNAAEISNTLPFTPTLTAQSLAFDYDVYLYSDFTGVQIDRQAPYIRLGSWSAIHDGSFPGIPWASISWNNELSKPLPPETKIVVAARAADSLNALGQTAFLPVSNGAPLNGLKGRFVELKVDFTGPGYETPVLTDLTITGPCGDNVGVACCLADSDCIPPDACSLGSCPSPGAACVFTKKPNCCLTDLDCDDNNPCTTGTCPLPGGSCDQVKAANCCVINKDCDDGEACTVDICSGPGGTCSNKAISGCCYEDKDCETGNKCLTAKCPEPGKLCELKPVPGCCSIDSDCNDNNACTLDACDVATSTCKVPEKVEGCCLSDGDCDDKNPCTTDICSEPGGKCKHLELAECCVPGGPGEGEECEPPKSPNDRPPCQAGKKKCNPVTNKFECEGAVKPSPETCDGVDNDCDGEVDKGEGLCSVGKACMKGQCASACKQGEFPCPSGYVCEGGYCILPEGTAGSGGAGGTGGSGASGQGAGGVNAGGTSAGGTSAGG
ncbi:MAG: hypothetical protein RMJ98_18835, partial [Myxococcales bacterium]|nr:hypothetical protein [Myxococcales bacterium]